MYRSVYDLKAFYNSKAGRMVRRILQERILEMWSDVRGMRILGCGYAVPYLRNLGEQAERTVAMMPAAQGALAWPYPVQGEKSLVCLAEDSELPFETGSVDRVILVHSLELPEMLEPQLQEVWRVVRLIGRWLVVVPSCLRVLCFVVAVAMPSRSLLAAAAPHRVAASLVLNRSETKAAYRPMRSAWRPSPIRSRGVAE